MVPSLMNLSMRSVLIKKLPHGELPESVQDRLQRIKKARAYSTEDLETFHYNLDITPQKKLAQDQTWGCVSAVAGSLTMFKLCLEYNCKINNQVILNIILFDRIEMLELLPKEQVNLLLPEMAFEIAVRNTSKTIKCLKYLYRNQPKNTYPLSVKYTKTAATYGNAKALELLHINGCEMNVETTNEAIKSGSVPCLQYAIDNGVPYNADRLTMLNASYNKRYAMFKFLHSQGHAMDAEMWHGPIEDKADDVVEYMINNGCAFDKKTIEFAAHVGHLPTLRRLREAGCPWDENLLVNTVGYGGKKPNIECFKYALKEGAPLSPRVLIYAVMYNSLQVLKLAINAGCPLPIEDLVNTAAKSGSLSCLKYLHKTRTIRSIHLRATLNSRHVNCLRYIMENTDLDIDVTMEYDIGDVKCYEYLRQRAEDDPEAYQIDPARVMSGAAMQGNMAMVKHIRTMYGVGWAPGLLMRVFETAPFDMFYYMVNNGAEIRELDVSHMLRYLANNVQGNRLTGDSKRKLGLLGAMFGTCTNCEFF